MHEIWMFLQNDKMIRLLYRSWIIINYIYIIYYYIYYIYNYTYYLSIFSLSHYFEMRVDSRKFMIKVLMPIDSIVLRCHDRGNAEEKRRFFDGMSRKSFLPGIRDSSGHRAQEALADMTCFYRRYHGQDPEESSTPSRMPRFARADRKGIAHFYALEVKV